MKAYNRTVDRWFELVRSGQVRLPRFQRFEAWTHQNVAGLLDTVIRELPAGAVLVLEIKGDEPFISRPVAGAPEGAGPVNEHLLDGQQRLTALWRALHDDYPDRTFFLVLEHDEETGRDSYIMSRGRWVKEGRRYPLYFDDPAELWNRRMIPVRLLRPDSDAEADLDQWVRVATSNGDEEPDYREGMLIQKHVARFRQRISHYNIPCLSLPETTPPDTALDVFIQMNTSATPLSTYDIVVAQVEAGVGRSLHDLAADLRESAPEVEAYTTVEDLMLSAAALLQDRTTNRTSFLAKGFADRLVADWPLIQMGMQRAVAFLEDERIFDGKRLPTDTILAPLVALWAEAPKRLDAEGEARTIMRRFLWRACFTERYERASNSRIHADYRALRRLIDGEDASPEIFDDELFPLPTADQFLDAGWPTRKDRLARAILALSLRRGGYDFADGTPTKRDNLPTREYHHLFPVAFLRDQGVEEQQTFGLQRMKEAMWRADPEGAFRFSDATDPDQAVLFGSGIFSPDYLLNQITEGFGDSDSVRVYEIAEWAISETPYLGKHMREALKLGEDRGAFVVASQKHDGSKRRAGTFPPGATIDFTARPPQPAQQASLF